MTTAIKRAEPVKHDGSSHRNKAEASQEANNRADGKQNDEHNIKQRASIGLDWIGLD
ncbi:MAG TPA: hypothetical protein VMM84_14595 [Pyrinomonadaceae bacterium]|nr:hypothetical protein [Pyrinomonadaceae bacterium]